MRRTAERQIAEVVIATLGDQGDGLAHHDGRRLAVPGALPGERHRVRIEAGSDRATSLGGSASPDRVAPPCPHFGPCGGCVSQHLSPPAELAWKLDRVRLALARRRLEAEVVVGHQSPLASRRRLRLGVERGRLGLRARGSRRLVAVTTCSIARPELVAVLEALGNALAALDGRPEEVALTSYAQGLELVLQGRRPLTLADREALTALAEHLNFARIAWRAAADVSPEPVLERRTPVLAWPGFAVAPPPAAFLQATVEAEAYLQSVVVAALGGCRRTVDLFAGIGTLAVAARATGAEVCAFERDPDATAALARSGGVHAEVRDLERRPLGPSELRGVDAVVLDPPRAGAAAQIETLAGSAVPLVVYVACAPQSFARDAARLVEGGFALDRVSVVDQFRFAAEVELVGVFRRAGGP